MKLTSGAPFMNKLSDEQKLLLRELDLFNIETRYPEHEQKILSMLI